VSTPCQQPVPWARAYGTAAPPPEAGPGSLWGRLYGAGSRLPRLVHGMGSPGLYSASQRLGGVRADDIHRYRLNTHHPCSGATAVDQPTSTVSA
jgi:hypothetical protein